MAKPSNTTYYVDCTGNQKLRDELLDYAVERGAKELYDRSIYSRTHAWMDLEEKAVFASAGEPEPITPATWKRKVRKIWGGLNPSKPRIKGRFAPKPKEPTQLDRIEGYLNKVGQAVIDQGREFKSKLNRIESSVTERIDALRMEQSALAQDTAIDPLMNNGIVEPQPASLQPGDYCDASEELADELTAMGFKWYDSDRTEEAYITPMRESCNELINTHQSYDTHLDAQTFLSRARVTAKELELKPVDLAAEEAKRKEAERAEKVAKLAFGVRVRTAHGVGIYQMEDEHGAHVVVHPDTTGYHGIDQITILP